jgi:hypothetical protein
MTAEVQCGMKIAQGQGAYVEASLAFVSLMTN